LSTEFRGVFENKKINRTTETETISLRTRVVHEAYKYRSWLFVVVVVVDYDRR